MAHDDNDDRFHALKRDPRYRLPSKKEARTAVDARFQTLFTDQEFRKKAAVDRYGRKIRADANSKELEKLYRLERDEEDAVEEEEEEEVKGKKRDPMREGFSASESEEESDEDFEDEEEQKLMSATAGIEQEEEGEEIPMGEVSRRIAAVNLDWDQIRAADLMAVALSFAPTGGKIENVTIYPSEFGRERLEREELEGPPKEIFGAGGAGGAAAAEESDDDDDDDDDEKDSDDDDDDDDEKIKNQLLSSNQATEESAEFDTAALRAYQLERLKYYYAVITCSDHQTAKALYDQMDGREYLSSANFFDLRFIPDDTSFDDDVPKDECTALGPGYRPNEFRTEALTHSKVRLTWDDDDATRKEVQKRAFSRAEMDENDLRAYIGSDEDSDVSTKSTASRRGKAGRKEEQRLKMRAALGLDVEDGSEKKPSKKGPGEELGEMQITFTSGLTNAGADDDASSSKKKKNTIFENEPQDEASTRERYIRKEKERKQARKERFKAARAGATTDPAKEVTAPPAAEEGEEESSDPFADPFFLDPAASTAAATAAARKTARANKRAQRAAADQEAEGRRAELELLMAPGGGEGDGGVVEHFDMREIEKAEKDEARRKKMKKGKKAGKKDGAEAEISQRDFQINHQDERFGAVFDSHEFAIDPTNPRFKKTKGMVGLLEAGRRKRKDVGGDEGEDEGKNKKKKKKTARKGDNHDDGEKVDEENVRDLVARLKKRSS